MGEYYDLIMEPRECSFSYYFNSHWHNQLDQMIKPYADALQLRIGNQLRPKLTCWGAAFNTRSIAELDLDRIAEISVYIEMLHKASIIVDDLVDDDGARHGEKTFHIEFGRDKTVMFALGLLSKGIAGINEIFRKSGLHYQSIDLYANTINRMAMGCLQELELDSTTRYDIDKIRRIINLETITLIKNSFLLGYWSNCKTNHEEENIIRIGENCGYIFQILNDLEPFASAKNNIAYKGSRNIDINRDRKNIVVAYIWGAASIKERQSLSDLSGEQLQALILKLYSKYSVYDSICHEARSLEKQTDEIINTMQQLKNKTGCLEDFAKFVHEMIDVCFSRLR